MDYMRSRNEKKNTDRNVIATVSDVSDTDLYQNFFSKHSNGSDCILTYNFNTDGMLIF